MAMTVPGMFLSQPGSEMLASYHCADITVSMLSAIRSRDCRLKLIPSERAAKNDFVNRSAGDIMQTPSLGSASQELLRMRWGCIPCLLHQEGMPPQALRQDAAAAAPVPIEMASLTPMVLNRYATIPASSTPAFTSAARSIRCILQVLPSYHTDEMPTCAGTRHPESDAGGGTLRSGSAQTNPRHSSTRQRSIILAEGTRLRLIAVLGAEARSEELRLRRALALWLCDGGAVLV